MTENETEMEERMRRKKEEEEAMWADYIEQRKQQRAKEEEELKKLKERQVRRKAQRSEQEKALLAMKRKQEEAKQREIDEKKAKDAEAKRKRLEEAEKKRQAMLDAMKEKDNQGAKPNFVISKRGGGAVAAISKSEMVKTKEQLAEDKRIALNLRLKKLDIEGLSSVELRKKATEMWELIIQLESEKYDLEERKKRQDYDLKELGERQKMINRNKALKKGLDPEAFTGKYPPKINTSSKYERRVDRRTFGDKKVLFEGGWEELYKQYIEKNWSERYKEWNDKGAPKLMKWDPCNPRNRETYEARKDAFDDDEEEINIMDFQPKEPEPVRRDPVRQPTPEPEEEEEEEEVEAESEEEEEEDEEEE